MMYVVLGDSGGQQLLLAHHHYAHHRRQLLRLMRCRRVASVRLALGVVARVFSVMYELAQRQVR